MTQNEMSDRALALRAFFLALMTIDRQRQGLPPDPAIEALWPATTAAVNSRFGDGR